MIKKVKKTIPWTYVIGDLNGEETVGTFYQKELQKKILEKCRIEKVNWKTCADVDKVLAWGSKGLSKESIKPSNISDTVLLQNLTLFIMQK